MVVTVLKVITCKHRQKFDCIVILPPLGVGPPPTQAGEEAYIVATELEGFMVYFEGFVGVGNSYTLNEDFSIDKLPPNMNITVYHPAGSTDPSTIVQGANIMQTLFVHLSCSQPLFLKDRFGSGQVVQWIEVGGRNVSCFQETVTGDLIFVSLDAENQDQPVRLVEMVIVPNFADEPINKTDEANGLILEPNGESIILTPINVPVIFTQGARYTFSTTIFGETLDGSQLCNGYDFHECNAGIALPPSFPTLAPTQTQPSHHFPPQIQTLPHVKSDLMLNA